MSSPFFNSGSSSSPDNLDQSDPSDKNDLMDMSCEDDIPEFGLTDVIEAFTAMRHEWRGQAREGRELSSAVIASVERIQQLENRLTAQLAIATSDEIISNLVNLIVDIDSHLSRAVDACVKYDAVRIRQPVEPAAAIRDAFEKQNFLARWFSRPFLQRALEILDTNASQKSPANPAMEGLQLVVSRLRRMMADRDIKRVDVTGKPFDAEIMNAVSVVEFGQYPPGHVVEELSPAYRWRGQLLRCADVRVSK